MVKKTSPVNQTVNKARKQIIRPSAEGINELLAQARELAWMGQHAKAIEICTQALDAVGKSNSRTAQLQLDLLDRRAESDSALLNIDAAKKDAVLMMRTANTEKKPGSKHRL